MILSDKKISDMLIEAQKTGDKELLKYILSPKSEIEQGQNEDCEIINVSFYVDGELRKVQINTGTPRKSVDKVLLWNTIFNSEYFRDKPDKFHRWLIALNLSPDSQYFGVPRGFSKTTILQGCIAYQCAYEMEKYIVVVEKTFTEASEVLAGVREMFASNELMVSYYGDLLKSKKNTVLEKKIKEVDREGDIFINGVRLKGKGFETNVRGLRSGAWRPSKIYCDDIEKDEHIDSLEQRRKYKDRFTKTIIPALDDGGKVNIQGTILHMDSLLMNGIMYQNGIILRAYYSEDMPEYESLDLEVEEYDGGEYKVLWGGKWGMEKLMKKKREMMLDNRGSSAFASEYLNDPAGAEDRAFKWEWLYNKRRVIGLEDLLRSGRRLSGVACIDWADSMGVNADYTGVVVHLADDQKNHYRVSVRNEKRNISGKMNLIFEIWEEWSKYGMGKILIEKSAFEDSIKPLFMDECRKRGVYPVVSEVKAPREKSKEARMRGNLEARYEMGMIWSVAYEDGSLVGDTDELLNQLWNHGKSKNDDLEDAESYVCQEMVYPYVEVVSSGEHRRGGNDVFE